MRVLIVGSGSIGQRHCTNLLSLGVDASIVPWRSYQPGVLDLCDAVVIATSTDVRLEPIVDAAARHIPIYIEKPAAFRPADLKVIQDVTSKVACRTVVGFMMRYHPAFLVLSQLDLSGTIRFNFCVGHDVTQWRAERRFSDGYASKADGGGVLLDLCHEIDMAAALFPDVALRDVNSLGHSNFHGVDFVSNVTLRTGSGVEGYVGMDYLTPRLHRRVIIHGEEFVYDFDFSGQRYLISDKRGDRLLDLHHERNTMFIDIMRDWILLLKGQKPENALVPLIDRVQKSSSLIAESWSARSFAGSIRKVVV